MPVCRYLDLSTSHVTEEEYEAVCDAFPAFDDVGPRVIRHQYGAWLNVQQDKTHEQSMAKDYPNVLACLDLARELDCNWINFDQDADVDALPTFDW